jgi:hypothetical protein
VGTQEVSDGEVAKLMLASGLADVQVKRARTLGRPGEEVEVWRLRRRRQQVSQSLQRLDVPLPRLERGDGEQKVEDRLGRKTRHGGRPHVLQAHRDVAERLLDAMKLRLGESRPAGLVIDDANGRVEAVIQRRMALLRAHPITVSLPENDEELRAGALLPACG